MKKDQKKLLGHRLKTARVSAGQSQDCTAEILGVTRQSVSAWETGASCPSALQLGLLAANYCVCAHALLFGEGFASWKFQPQVAASKKSLERSGFLTGG